MTLAMFQLNPAMASRLPVLRGISVRAAAQMGVDVKNICIPSGILGALPCRKPIPGRSQDDEMRRGIAVRQLVGRFCYSVRHSTGICSVVKFRQLDLIFAALALWFKFQCLFFFCTM